MKEIHGICPILAAPFTAGGEVDYAGLARLVQHLNRTGVQAITLFGLVPPFFLSPPAAAVREHILRVADAVSLPVIVQYAPVQTGLRLSPDFFVDLWRDAANVRYVKVEVQPPGPFISELRERSGGAVQALVGYAAGPGGGAGPLPVGGPGTAPEQSVTAVRRTWVCGSA